MKAFLFVLVFVYGVLVLCVAPVVGDCVVVLVVGVVLLVLVCVGVCVCVGV